MIAESKTSLEIEHGERITKNVKLGGVRDGLGEEEKRILFSFKI